MHVLCKTIDALLHVIKIPLSAKTRVGFMLPDKLQKEATTVVTSMRDRSARSIARRMIHGIVVLNSFKPE